MHAIEDLWQNINISILGSAEQILVIFIVHFFISPVLQLHLFISVLPIVYSYNYYDRTVLLFNNNKCELLSNTQHVLLQQE